MPSARVVLEWLGDGMAICSHHEHVQAQVDAFITHLLAAASAASAAAVVVTVMALAMA